MKENDDSDHHPDPVPIPPFTPPDCASASGATMALDGFDLDVEPGTVHGLLGPNGAGKTTAVRCLTTLTTIDDGTATIDGSTSAPPAAVRERIGLVGQFHAVDEALTARQNLVLFARLSGISKSRARARADDLFEAFELTDAADRPVAGFSGGMRRRLDIAASLVLTPADPVPRRADHGPRPARSRHRLAGGARDRRRRHHRAAHHAVPRRGRPARRPGVGHGARAGDRRGQPDDLKRRLGGDRVDAVIADGARLAEAVEAINRATGAAASADADTRT